MNMHPTLVVVELAGQNQDLEMTRFPEGKRLEDALEHGDLRELTWALHYARTRLQFAPNDRQRKDWSAVVRRIDAAIAANGK